MSHHAVMKPPLHNDASLLSSPPSVIWPARHLVRVRRAVAGPQIAAATAAAAAAAAARQLRPERADEQPQPRDLEREV